jgi:hypothetical protein
MFTKNQFARLFVSLLTNKGIPGSETEQILHRGTNLLVRKFHWISLRQFNKLLSRRPLLFRKLQSSRYLERELKHPTSDNQENATFIHHHQFDHEEKQI